ncbi:MAG: methylenetetrahydrofolate reductase [NAD(P)H] [bacterium]
MNSQWSANTTAYQDRAASDSELRISLEMFPPGNELAVKSFDDALIALAALNPQFISVTCGAGGTDNRATEETISQLRQRVSVPVAAHLTCINKSKQQVEKEVLDYLNLGVNQIVALRGDLPADGISPAPSGYQSALGLVRGIRDLGEFTISVAGYPEGHPEATSVDEEIQYLKRKVDAGADQIITQFFFDTEVFLHFLDRVRDAGITVPVIPGILPIENFTKAVGFAKRCGARIPHWYHVMYQDLEQNPQLHAAISTSIAVEQCRQLMAFGVTDLHFYTLNRAPLTLSICRKLGVEISDQPQKVSQVSGF